MCGRVVVECGQGADQRAHGRCFGVGPEPAVAGNAPGHEPHAREATGDPRGLGALGGSQAGAAAVAAEQFLQALLPTRQDGEVGDQGGFAFGNDHGRSVGAGGTAGEPARRARVVMSARRCPRGVADWPRPRSIRLSAK